MNRTLVVINLVLLMAIVFLPFPTSVLGSYVSAPNDAHVAAILYALTFLFLAACFTLFWAYALSQPQLLTAGFDRAAALRQLPRFSVGFVIYLICIGVAQISPVGVIVIIAATAGYYVFQSVPNRPQPGS